jgi:DNA-binding MarR family transcriptional regulator/GNAT superfamily N-acetyltransferase
MSTIAMTTADVAIVRGFNRFYTRQIGALEKRLLESPFTLAEARVLYELANRKEPTATELGAVLGLDAGYLSRILGGFEQRGLVAKHASKGDARRSVLALTTRGRRAFAALDARSASEVRAMIERVPTTERARMVDAMRTIEEVLGEPATPKDKAYTLRDPRSGDFGWIVHRHGVLYRDEHGWDERFEGLVAGVVAEYVEKRDPSRERVWIAEMHGKIVGCIFLVRGTSAVAKLRLLLVEPEARGVGLGTRLVDECVKFARSAGYRKISLWTNHVLVAARGIYERAGFEIVAREQHRRFGPRLVAETWEKKL